ncbi:O-antigen ligase family protein [Candidatus Omnitrophota bacterium]
MAIKKKAEISILLLLPVAMAAGAFPSLVPHFMLSLALVALAVFFISFINTNFALVVLIFSMLLSPEFEVGGIPGRTVVLRADDILLFVVFLGWFFKMAINKELGLIRSNPLNRPIIVYIFVTIIATLLGAFQGYVEIKQSFFYLLKYVEYFIIFFMVANNLKTVKQARIFVFFLLLTCFFVCLYTYMNAETMTRASAPFEGETGEPNTLGGYLLLMIAVTIGLLLHSQSTGQSILLIGLLGCMVVPYLQTLSRGAWLGFLPMFITLIIITRKKKVILFLILIFLVVLGPFILPQRVKGRILITFLPGRHYELLGKRMTFDESSARRIESWRHALQKWSRRPLLGQGVPGGVNLDAQYPRVLLEVGLIGFMVFIWLKMMIFRAGWRAYVLTKDNTFAQGLSLGFLAGFVGLLAHAFVAETFILIRIMEPFWFLAAIVVMLPEIASPPQEKLA